LADSLQAGRVAFYLFQYQSKRSASWWSSDDRAGPTETEETPHEEQPAPAPAPAREQDEPETGDGSENTFDGQKFDYSLSAMDRQYATQTSVPRRIHILGTGSIGKLVAHSIRGIANPPPVTLLLHKRTLLQAWENSAKEVTIQDDGIEVRRKGFEVELLPLVRRQHGVAMKEGEPDLYEHSDSTTWKPHEAAKALKEQETLQEKPEQQLDEDLEVEPKEDDTIHNLIVTTKAAFTVNALANIKHRLLPTSTICFLQNGMGVIDEVNQKLFPDEDERPNYMQGIITHGVNVPPAVAERNPFYAVHAGHGTIALSLIPSTQAKKAPTDLIRSSQDIHDIQDDRWADSSRYLIRTLTRTPVLCAVGFTPTELLQLQLEKLAVNSVLNPLTVILDARNGSILYNFAITRTMRLLLAETSLVIRSLPELQNIPNVAHRFSAQRLETLVVSVANTTRDNISSMLADVRAGRQTEVEYINGYIVRRGEEIGIKCVVNYSTMQMVIGKSAVTQREVRGEYASEPRDPNA
jgi:2-dehydropantoate 2-reductase